MNCESVTSKSISFGCPYTRLVVVIVVVVTDVANIMMTTSKKIMTSIEDMFPLIFSHFPYIAILAEFNIDDQS
jgi:uncharacterized membrane protein SpoIIM required for sporulation